MIKINKKKLTDYKKKGYSSALEYRIDLMRNRLSQKFSSMKDYVNYIKHSARLGDDLLLRDKGKRGYKAKKP